MTEPARTTPVEGAAAGAMTHRSAPDDFLPRPELAPPGVWSFPTPTRTRLDNGIETVVFRLPGQHVVSANLVLDIPLNAEDRDREGIATI